MKSAAVPSWFTSLLKGGARGRSARAAVVLDAHRPWDEVRKGLAAAVLVDPATALTGIEALRLVADSRRDRPSGARLRLLEARAIHRGGSLDEALTAYADAERRLRGADLAQEAESVAVARVDALATSGRVAEALRLAQTAAKRLKRRAPTLLSASLSVNRANALRMRGELEKARAAYEAAAKTMDALGSAYGANVARWNAGVALLESGDVAEARRRFARAAQAFAAAGATDLAREARYDLACADVQSGRLGEGIRSLEALASEHRAASLPRREALCRMDLADALRRAGDRPAAEKQAVLGASVFRTTGARAERAEALFLAAFAAASEDPKRAALHLARARAAAKASDRPALVLRCDVLAADLSMRRGSAPSPRSLAAVAKRARTLGQRSLATEADLLAGASLLDGGDARAAGKRFAAVLRAARGRPWLRASAEAGLASVEAAGDAAGRGAGRALARLSRVARFLDGVRSGLPGAWLRAQFVAERLDPYLARLDLLLRRDRPSDRREAEALLNALGARRFLEGGFRAPRNRRLDRIRGRLEAIYDRLARGEGATRGVEPGFGGEFVLERRARAWERAAAEEWRRLERRGAVRPGESTADPRSAVLPPGVALVHIWKSGEEARGLIRIGREVGRSATLGPVADLDAYGEALRLHARRWSAFQGRGVAATDPESAERLLRELADRVLVPLEAATAARDVWLAIDPEIPDLPWEMLPSCGGRLSLVSRVLRVPAAGIRASKSPGVAEGRGTVVIALGEPDLPGVTREVEAIAKAAGAAQVVCGPAADRAAVVRALSEAAVVHVAGHGWEATEAPPLGGIRVADGWFTAADLPESGVAADLVVLAACRTGRVGGRANLAWGGLVPALLSAGARRVIWTADDVDDAATASLMADFHAIRASAAAPGPVRSAAHDVYAFGRALADTVERAGHPGAALPFRMSGVPS